MPVTDTLEQRMSRAREVLGGDYTVRRRLVRLVWSESFATRDQAFATERRVKGWSRAKKEALIAGDWERLQQLARNQQDR